jgi:hypothetical protein
LFTTEEKEAIRNLLTNAESVQEIEEIENAVRKGLLPDKLRLQQQQQKRLNGNGEDTSNDDMHQPATKRLKVA